ncbi:6-hydroxymethylpterin diphosphokinase MptE-like protein [Oceanospirillum beijerinckii]|uniref:motility associated factor glycosyltransferase family protein n=1 Tax=Oceanospirillum beijerinckii TaxID=64976 RepID=UPI0004208D65|nr:6-hydroxymethylpterin diphosphokinase MptE-like protein [Oceanospirillum beijerinckii]
MGEDIKLSDDAAKLAAFFMLRLESNLKAFEKVDSSIYEEFKDYSENNYFLIFDDEGRVNLLDASSGGLVYDKNPYEQIINNLETYRKSPIFNSAICINGEKPKEGNPNFVHNTLVYNIGQAQAKVLSRSLIDRINRDNDTNPYQISSAIRASDDVKDLPVEVGSMVCLSIGLGFDVEKLYLEHDIANLYIIEPDKDVFYASMQLVDWKKVIDKMEAKGFTISIMLSDDFDELLGLFSHSVSLVGRHTLGGCYIYSAFFKECYSDLFEGLKNRISRDLTAGFGFYDDSRMSVAHTYHNFKNKIPSIKKDFSVNKDFGQKDVPVFVVGNGPSLDKDLEYIKNNQEAAVVISCGTSLGALYHKNIKPDIYVELERPYDTVSLLENISDDIGDFLSDTIFVGMSQVHPDLFQFFGRGGQMPKDTESGSLLVRKLFADEGVSLVTGVGPSCVHSGFTVAVLLGFRQVYFFGVDMGYRSSEHHHSKYSIYNQMNDERKEAYTPKLKGASEFEPNFGDEVVYSSGFYPMYKVKLDQIVSAFVKAFPKNMKVYNCSDGAKILGAEPVHSFDLDLNPLEINKASMLQQIYESHFSYVADDLALKEIETEIQQSIEVVDDVCNWFQDVIYPVETVPEAQSLLDKISYGFQEDKELISDDDAWIYTIFNGSVLYCLSAVSNMLYFPTDENVRISSFNMAMESVREFFVLLRDDYKKGAMTAYDHSIHYF